MKFYTDCDTILKIHNDYYLDGAFTEDYKAKSANYDKFVEICKANLHTQQDGYFQAVQYTLTNDGYLESIGKLPDLITTVHYVTPKGFAFVLNGGYAKIVYDLEKKSFSETATLISGVRINAGFIKFGNKKQNGQAKSV